jgi:hypothetical protein
MTPITSFSQAYQRLKEIALLLKSDNLIDIDQIVQLQDEAKHCYELCQTTLKKHTDNHTTDNNNMTVS